MKKSFRDINTVLKKAAAKLESENNKKQSADDKVTEIVVDKSTQAYKLFSEGKKPIQVAIALGLDRKETIRLYRDVWKLKHLYTLDSVYEQIGDELRTFLRLYKIAKNQGMLDNLEAFVSILKNAAYNIPALQKQHELVKNKVETIQYQKQEGDIELQRVGDRIVELKKLEQSHAEVCRRLQQEIGDTISMKSDS